MAPKVAALRLEEMRRVVSILEQVVSVDEESLTEGEWEFATMQQCIVTIRGALADDLPQQGINADRREQLEQRNEYKAKIASLKSALKDVSADIGYRA